jgi:sodium/bile acid cotransporter 7
LLLRKLSIAYWDDRTKGSKLLASGPVNAGWHVSLNMNAKAHAAKVHWIRGNGFLIGLLAAVGLAFAFPAPGSKSGVLHPDLLNNLGIALILLLQGLSLAFEQIKGGLGNWRLHFTIQAFTFVIFPLIGLLGQLVSPWVWPSEPGAIRLGFLFLCVLPSAVSTSVVFTSVARGNTAGALFNAALSNIIGVVATPVLVQLLRKTTGQSAPLGSLLFKILLLTFVPFFAGMLLRTLVQHWVTRHKAWTTRISNTVILFIVYSAFCDSVTEKTWQTYGLKMTAETFGAVVVLFSTISALVYASGRLLHLNREDAIATYFCAVKKTLAMGVPLAILIFGRRSDLPLILLPIMLYHPLQLLVNGVIANQLAKQIPSPPQEKRPG